LDKPPVAPYITVNRVCVSVHKYILRNVFTDLEHNDVEI